MMPDKIGRNIRVEHYFFSELSIIFTAALTPDETCNTSMLALNQKHKVGKPIPPINMISILALKP